MEEYLICDIFQDNYKCWRFHGKHRGHIILRQQIRMQIEESSITMTYMMVNDYFDFSNVVDSDEDTILLGRERMTQFTENYYLLLEMLNMSYI